MTPKAIELWNVIVCIYILKRLYVQREQYSAGNQSFFFVRGFGAGSWLDPGKAENCEKKSCKQGFQIRKKGKKLKYVFPLPQFISDIIQLVLKIAKSLI
jgi:hypothetical protein